MAAGDALSPERIIYRALSRKYLNESETEASDTAFLLKPAHDEWPAETHLSFGVTREAASKGLSRIRQICEITVGDIIQLGLSVTEDTDPEKVRVSGMPLITENDTAAFLTAKRLREKSKICK